MGLLVAVMAACSEPPSVESTAQSPFALGTTRQAASSIPSDFAFSPYRCGGANAGDIPGDSVSANRERDLVGDATYPAFFRAADANSVFFRMRVDSNPLASNGVDLLPSSWDVLVDTDNDPRTYEYMLTADGNLAGTQVQWVRNSTPEPSNPSDPAGEVPEDLLQDFTPATAYYHVQVAADGSTFNGDPDYFITLILPKTVLTAAGISTTANLVVWGGTNSRSYSLNEDFGCSFGLPFHLADAAPDPAPLDPAGTPDAFPDTAITNEDTAVTTAVLTNDLGLRDMPLTVTIVKPPSTGTAVVNANNTITFTPAANASGTTTYTYQVQNAFGLTDTAEVTVKVNPVNDPPTGGADTFTVAGNGAPIPLDVLANDSSEPDGGETLTVSAVTQPASGGTIAIGDGGANVVFTPAPGFRGSVTFTYTVSDGNGGSTIVPVTVNVSSGDSDGDGLSDDDELQRGTDPHNPDTDGGGVKDGDEVRAGTNPLNYTDDLAMVGRGCASTGPGTLPPLGLLLALSLLWRRRALRGAGKTWAVWGLLIAVLASTPARAQNAAQASQGIDVQQFKPGPGAMDVLGVQSPRVGQHLDWNVGLSFSYARAPLNFRQPQTGQLIAALKNQSTFDLMGSVALYDQFELGVALPITSQNSAPSVASVAPVLGNGVHATGVGDLRLVPKALLRSLDNGLRFGVSVPVLLPTSGGKEFLGRRRVAFFPRLLGEWSHEGGVRVLVHLGLNVQHPEQFYNLNVSNEFAYGLGAEVPFQVGPHRLAAEATLVGARGLNEWNLEERPLEVLAALKYRFTDSLAAQLGGGPGVTRGYGTPGFRLLAGISWSETAEAAPARIKSPPPPESPRSSEDMDRSQPESPRGSEDMDRSQPESPQGSEDMDRFQNDTRFAAPDADTDTDGDGVRDADDLCPNQRETRNGFEDGDGCPDELPRPRRADSDGDGISDDQDRCPQIPEDKDGFQDEDGCPDPDNDQDGVPDTLDRCPNEPETLNGFQDEDGCPDESPEKARPR